MSTRDSERVVTMMTCPRLGCERKDLRGRGGVSMHVRRAHGANWSTKPRARREAQ